MPAGHVVSDLAPDHFLHHGQEIPIEGPRLGLLAGARTAWTAASGESRPGKESEKERDVAGGGGGGGDDGSGMGVGVAVVGKTVIPPARATGRYTCAVGCVEAAEGRLWWEESLRSDPDRLPGLKLQSVGWPPSLLVRFSGRSSSAAASSAARISGSASEVQSKLATTPARCSWPAATRARCS